MRNIQHIQLKEIDPEEDKDFEYDGNGDVRPRKKKDLEGGFDASMDSHHDMQHLGILSKLWYKMTYTKQRKSILLASIVLCVLLLTITLSIATKSKSPKISTNTALYSDLKLPTWIKPVHYLVYIKTEISQNRFNGSVVATINITKSDTNQIVVHADELQLNSVYLQPLDSGVVTYPTTHVAPSSAIKPTSISYDTNNTYYVLEFNDLPKLIKDGKQYFNLYMYYNANLTDSLRGLYKSKYGQPPRYLASTQFEPTDARAALPCFDEPSLKANWTIWLDIDPEYQALSNMPEMSITNIDNQRQLVKFKTSPKMSSYLVCMVIHQFSNITGTVQTLDGRDITVRVWASDQLVNSTQFALDVAQKSITYYTNYFKIDYPLEKMDLIGIPDFAAGAMENWGCITFREIDLFYSNVTATVDEKQRVAEVVAHEIAHQWFGNLVTMKWWNDLWLNEGFATFMSYKALANTMPEFDSQNDFLYIIKQTGLGMDAKLSTHSISNNYVKVIDIESSFDSITYDKGSSVLLMLESLLNIKGVDYFQMGIQSYLKKFQYSNAETSDLWNSLHEASSGVNAVDVSQVMKLWVSSPGFPYISVTEKDNSFSITQTRFLEDINATTPSTSAVNWQIPLTIQTGCSSTDSPQLFTTQSETIKNDHPECEFSLFNYDGTGFHRVLYDKNMFAKIVTQINTTDVITNQGIISFIDDTFNFVKNGKIETGQALDMAMVFKTNNITNPSIWKTAMSGLSFIYSRLKSQPCYNLYVKFVSSLLDNFLANTNVTQVSPDATYMDLLVRKTLIKYANSYHKLVVVNYLNQVWESNVNTPQLIDPNIRSTLYSSIIANSAPLNDTAYNWVFARYSNTTSINEKIDALKALGTAQEPYLYTRTLNMLLDNSVRTQDYGTLISTLSDNGSAMDDTWRFMKDNFNYLSKVILPSHLGDYFKYFSTQFDTPSLYNEYKSFMADKAGIIPANSITLALESIQNNIDWVQKNGKGVCEWFNNNVNK